MLIAQGYKNKEIAEKMFITEQTVKNHLQTCSINWVSQTGWNSRCTRFTIACI